MNNTPHHIAIIMDGNRRWAKRNGREALFGHEQGAKTLKSVARAVHEKGCRWLTVFAFSFENWTRPKAEVDGLMLLLRRFLENDINELNGENVKLRVIGSRDRLSSRLGSLIEWAEDETSGNTGLNLSIALDYGGRQELTNAARILATEVDRGIIKASDINEDILKSRMASSALPDIDLLIRTGGEQRLSNFMLWDMSYAELFFSPELWPDFSGESLDRALSSFAARDRRFGGNSKTDTGHPEEVATNVTRINAGSRQA
jgi:undecaprenyl diphosphate synthase